MSVKKYIIIVFILGSTMVHAQESARKFEVNLKNKHELFQELFNQLNPRMDYGTLINSKLNSVDSSKAATLIYECDSVYENNNLTTDQRFLFYKNIISKSQIKHWPAKLKSIILIKCVEFDNENFMPVYKQLELQKVDLVKLVDQFIIDEFSFVAKTQYDALEDAKERGYEVEEVELSDEQREEAIDIVYNKLANDRNQTFLFD